MLRRLNQVKPSAAEINRAKQLDDYHKQISYYCPELRTDGDFNATFDGPPRRSKSSHGFTAGLIIESTEKEVEISCMSKINMCFKTSL